MEPVGSGNIEKVQDLEIRRVWTYRLKVPACGKLECG
jgi:hypothetical protein